MPSSSPAVATRTGSRRSSATDPALAPASPTNFKNAQRGSPMLSLAPSARGELEITDVNNAYIARGLLQYDATDGYWVDCGESFESYLRAQNLVAERGANR